MNKIKLFAWDFHGTLEIGTDISFTKLMQDVAKNIGYKSKIDLKTVRKHFGISILDYLKLFFPKLSHEELIRIKANLRKMQSEEHMKKYVQAAPYALEVCQKIKKAGHRNIIVSTSAQKHIEKFLRVVKLTKYFDQIFGIDRHSLDGEFDIASQKARAIKIFADNHKVKPDDIIMIGDREGDIEAGILVGATTYQYLNPDFPTRETRADHKITDLREVLREV